MAERVAEEESAVAQALVALGLAHLVPLARLAHGHDHAQGAIPEAEASVLASAQLAQSVELACAWHLRNLCRQARHQ